MERLFSSCELMDTVGHEEKGGEFFRLRLDTTAALVVQGERECLPREGLASLRSRFRRRAAQLQVYSVKKSVNIPGG